MTRSRCTANQNEKKLAHKANMMQQRTCNLAAAANGLCCVCACQYEHARGFDDSNEK